MLELNLVVRHKTSLIRIRVCISIDSIPCAETSRKWKQNKFPIAFISFVLDYSWLSISTNLKLRRILMLGFFFGCSSPLPGVSTVKSIHIIMFRWFHCFVFFFSFIELLLAIIAYFQCEFVVLLKHFSVQRY